MKDIKIEDNYYEIIENYKEGYNEDEFIKKCTDYFYEYDYIVGDWAYGKLRLKGFLAEENKKVKDYNNIKFVEEYIINNCAYQCKYFILKREI